MLGDNEDVATLMLVRWTGNTGNEETNFLTSGCYSPKKFFLNSYKSLNVLFCILIYAAHAFCGHLKTEINQLQSMLNRAKKWGLVSTNYKLGELLDRYDRQLFLQDH